MKKIIQVSGNNDLLLSVELLNLLDLITNGEEYFWYLSWLDAEGNFNDKNSDQFEIEIEKSSRKHPIEWDQLKLLGHSFEQILDIGFFACSGSNDSEPIIWIELFDSSYWIVKTNLVDLIDKLTEDKSFGSVILGSVSDDHLEDSDQSK